VLSKGDKRDLLCMKAGRESLAAQGGGRQGCPAGRTGRGARDALWAPRPLRLPQRFEMLLPLPPGRDAC